MNRKVYFAIILILGLTSIFVFNKLEKYNRINNFCDLNTNITLNYFSNYSIIPRGKNVYKIYYVYTNGNSIYYLNGSIDDKLNNIDKANIYLDKKGLKMFCRINKQKDELKAEFTFKKQIMERYKYFKKMRDCKINSVLRKSINFN